MDSKEFLQGLVLLFNMQPRELRGASTVNLYNGQTVEAFLSDNFGQGAFIYSGKLKEPCASSKYTYVALMCNNPTISVPTPDGASNVEPEVVIYADTKYYGLFKIW